MKMTSLKLLCVLAGIIGMSAFTAASAGTIGGTTTNWNSWSEAAGLLAARKWMS